MIADFVKCFECGKQSYVECGCEICPLCGDKGGLSWAGEDNEIEIYEYELNKEVK